MTGPQDERMPRHRVMWAVYTGRPLTGAAGRQGIAEAQIAADKLGDGLISGLAAVAFLAVGAPAVAGDAVLVGVTGAAVVVYLGGLSYAVRARAWLRRRSS